MDSFKALLRINGNSEFINPKAISSAQGKDLRELVELLEISDEIDTENGEEQKSKEQVTKFQDKMVLKLQRCDQEFPKSNQPSQKLGTALENGNEETLVILTHLSL